MSWDIVYAIHKRLDRYQQESGYCTLRGHMQTNLTDLMSEITRRTTGENRFYESIKQLEWTETPKHLERALCYTTCLSTDEIVDICELVRSTRFSGVYEKLFSMLPGDKALFIRDPDEVNTIRFRAYTLPNLYSITLMAKPELVAQIKREAIQKFIRRHGAVALSQSEDGSEIKMFFDDDDKAAEAKLRI